MPPPPHLLALSLLLLAPQTTAFIPLVRGRGPLPTFTTTRQQEKDHHHVTTVAAAASAEDDLELTRQIIMDHIGQGASKKPLMVRAALGEDVEKTPVWLFRQAGRHLPEYTEYKKKVGRNFLEMLQYPEDVAECTLQPIRRYPLDAAILFSDILVIPQAIGMSVTMPGGVGILVPEPISTPADVSSYDLSTDAALSKLTHVFDSVSLIKKKMSLEGYGATPLIGFSAAPFTLLFYMVGGSSKKNPEAGVGFLKKYPEEGRALLDKLTDIVIEYLVAQAERGADMIQLFEAMGMMIGEDDFLEWELGCLEKIGKSLKERLGEDMPLLVFARGAGYANKHLVELDTFDVITIDGEASRTTIRDDLPGVTLQGNYDPKELIEDEGKTPETVKESAVSMLTDLGCERLIANLGEGLGGRETPALVKVFVDCIHEESERMIAEKK